MPSEEYKKAFLYLSNKCSKKEITSKEALVLASKFKLKIVDKKHAYSSFPPGEIL
jgi:hypothetical protein